MGYNLTRVSNLRQAHIIQPFLRRIELELKIELRLGAVHRVFFAIRKNGQEKEKKKIFSALF